MNKLEKLGVGLLLLGSFGALVIMKTQQEEMELMQRNLALKNVQNDIMNRVLQDHQKMGHLLYMTEETKTMYEAYEIMYDNRMF